MDQAVKAVEKIGKEKLNKALKGAAEKAAEMAEYLYLSAEYDGDVSDIEVRVKERKNGGYTVTAKGEAVPFIEYGTGEAVGHTSKQTGEPWWFYTLPPGNRFGAGGTYASYEVIDETKEERMEGALSETSKYLVGGMLKTQEDLRKDFDRGVAWKVIAQKDQSIKSQNDFVRKLKSSRSSYEDRGDWARAAYSYFLRRMEHTKVDVKPETKTTKSYVRKRKKGSGITKGNEPQHVMDQAMEAAVQYLERKYNAK